MQRRDIMAWLMILIILLFVGGIVLLSAKSPLETKTREQFLQELAAFLHEKLEPIEDEEHKNSFRIRFEFDGESFVYENLEKQGFKGKIYKSYLKVKIPSKLTLTFTEKRRSMRIRNDIFIASEISAQDIDKSIQLQVPKSLKDMNVFSNDPAEANRIFEDRRIEAIFRQFKNVDDRGYPFLSIGIVDGAVILEFYPQERFTPNLSALQSDIASIEDLLEKLIVVVRKFKDKS